MAEEVAALSVRLEATVAKFEAQLKRAEGATRAASRKMKRDADEMNRGLSEVGSRFGLDLSSRAAVAAGAVGALALAVRSVARAGDDIRQLEGRFRALTGSAERAGALVEGVFGTALGTGAGVRDVGNLAAQFRLVTQQLGATDDQVLQFTSNLVKLGAIGGSSTQQMADALRQLGQGLGAGVLRAEEFNSVIEGTPMVAQALADALAGGSLGALRQMVLEGRVLSRDVFAAILQQTGQIDEKFRLIPQSIERATNNLNTAMAALLGQLDGALGISRNIAAAIQAAADAINQLRDWNRPGGGFDTGQANLRRGALVEERAGLERSIAGSEARAARLGVSQEAFTRPLRERIAAIDVEIAALERRIAGNAPAGAGPIPATLPPAGGAAPAAGRRGAAPADPLSSVLANLRSRDRDALEAQAAAQLAANPSLTDENRDQLLITLRAVNDLREAHRRLAEETGRPVEPVTPEQIARIETYAFGIASAEAETRRLRDAQLAAAAAAQRQAQALENLGSNMAAAIGQARSFKGALEGIARVILTAGLQGLFTGAGAFGSLGTAVFGAGGATGAIGRSVGGFGPGPTLNALGNAYAGGRVIPFARGGVIDRPTTFPMAGRAVGLMGEAGPEAILPLKRGPGGRLGVEASGGGGVSVSNVYHFAPGVSPDQLRAEGERIKRDTIAAIVAARRENKAFLA